MVEVRRGDELGERYRRRITEVYVRAFADDFVAFSRDPGKLADAFEHMLLLERFHVALVDGEPAGLASLTEGDQTLFAPRWPEIRRHLGPVRGLLAYAVIRRWFMRPSAGARPGLAEIGFVATEPGHQGRGVGTALLRHLLALPRYREYVSLAFTRLSSGPGGLLHELHRHELREPGASGEAHLPALVDGEAELGVEAEGGLVGVLDVLDVLEARAGVAGSTLSAWP